MKYLSVSPRVAVRELVKTVEFYRDTLGFDVGEPWPVGDPTFAIVARDGVTLQFDLVKDLPDEFCKTITLCLNVDDARKIHEELKDKIATEWGPEVYWYGRREFAIRDPNGVLLIFSEETDEMPTCLVA